MTVHVPDADPVDSTTEVPTPDTVQLPLAVPTAWVMTEPAPDASDVPDADPVAAAIDAPTAETVDVPSALATDAKIESTNSPEIGPDEIGCDAIPSQAISG